MIKCGVSVVNEAIIRPKNYDNLRNILNIYANLLFIGLGILIKVVSRKSSNYVHYACAI
jgi:hypothetical protein